MKNRVGEQKKNKYGSLMTIVEYENNKNITVEFENGYKVKAQYGQFKNGSIRNPYDKTVYGIGCIGEGDYDSSSIQYGYWSAFMTRCYDKRFEQNNKTYKNCSVCEEWHNFQNFAKWFDENYYECNNEKMQLDKDILIKGNKVYSPETCVFVPQRINLLFTKSDCVRGKYPIGVNKNKSKFQANCSIFNEETNSKKRIFLGTYDTPEEAFYKYKEFKENYIKEVAEEYKELIPINLYEAMNNYIISIDD